MSQPQSSNLRDAQPKFMRTRHGQWVCSADAVLSMIDWHHEWFIKTFALMSRSEQTLPIYIEEEDLWRDIFLWDRTGPALVEYYPERVHFSASFVRDTLAIWNERCPKSKAKHFVNNTVERMLREYSEVGHTTLILDDIKAHRLQWTDIYNSLKAKASGGIATIELVLKHERETSSRFTEYRTLAYFVFDSHLFEATIIDVGGKYDVVREAWLSDQGYRYAAAGIDKEVYIRIRE